MPLIDYFIQMLPSIPADILFHKAPAQKANLGRKAHTTGHKHMAYVRKMRKKAKKCR